MYTYKVMIHPNNKQETKIRRTLNKCIECNNIVFDYLNNILENKEPFPKCGDVRKWFTTIKKEKDNEVILKRKNMTKHEMIANHLDTLFYDVSNDALSTQNAVIDREAIKELYPGLEEIVDILIDNHVPFSHDGVFELTDEDNTVIASAAMIIDNPKIAIDPFDDKDKLVFIEKGYKVITQEDFSIEIIK